MKNSGKITKNYQSYQIVIYLPTHGNSTEWKKSKWTFFTNQQTNFISRVVGSLNKKKKLFSPNNSFVIQLISGPACVHAYSPAQSTQLHLFLHMCILRITNHTYFCGGRLEREAFINLFSFDINFFFSKFFHI